MNFSALFLKYLCFIILVLKFTFATSQNTFVPDDNFEQALIDLGLDTGPLDDVVPTVNIVSEEVLTIDGRNIQDLTGIEDFSALKQLFIQNNNLTNINVSNNQNLQILWCFNNTLQAIDTSQNPNIISFRCENNNITDLDISNNTALNIFTCDRNEITNIDTSNNESLTVFTCGKNRLNAIDVSENINLLTLSCEDNFLSNLNLESNTNLSVLNCSNNSIFQLNLSLNRTLTELNCTNNNLCLLNIKNGNNSNLSSLDFSGNPDLKCVIIDDMNVPRTNWIPITFTDYAASIDDCNSGGNVDEIEDVISTSYALPSLTNGNYFTQSGGNGISLNVGDIISTSQTIFIYDEADCLSKESSFNVIISDQLYLIPKYFTPNNDGVNDRWQIIDTNNQINTISIYNRYGKLLKFLSSTSQSWNGTFDNQILPNDTYWYEIILNNQEILRGYFALKR